MKYILKKIPKNDSSINER